MLEKLIGGFITILVGITVLNEMAKPNELIGWQLYNKTPARQTYLEYVKERLEVERLMRW